jgi:glycine cleavage system protein P-like pyridoxal-binding family
MRMIDAYFTNEQRTVVNVLWENDKKEVVEETVLVEANEPAWENLLNQPNVTLDNLHERTVNRNREQRAIFEQQVVEIAKRDGLIYDGDHINTDIYKMFVQTIFNTELTEKEVKEQLFMFKLALFELDKIKESNNREMKAALRKAETLPSALKIACELFESDFSS